MRVYIIISIILAVLAIVFSIQNSQAVLLHIGPWTVEGPLGLLILTAFVMGVVVGLFASIAMKMSKKQKEKKKLHPPVSQDIPSVPE